MSYSKYFNVYIGSNPDKGRPMFQPELEKGEWMPEFLEYKEIPYWSTVLRDTGIAKSISEAKGAGWHRKVEDGFQNIYFDGLSEWKGIGHGRHPHRITILNEVNYVG